ncbi:serine hydrolase [Clostridium hydrogeniformans]|uniref:serine hydrolase n=1 Tax=Clostridium hydrogeniformans TaxID=349933 RepID=UPI000482EF6F|nr:serine hydrolase [Clostridium hydrogeniformans]
MKEVKRYLESRLGEYSFYFEDLDGGYVYGFNEGQQIKAGECIHLPLIIALFNEVEASNISLSHRIKVSSRDSKKNNSLLKRLGEKEYSVKELIIFMIIENDCEAYEHLVSLIGVDNINNHIKGMGLRNTCIVDNESFDGFTTAYDLSKCWRILKHGEYINKENRNFLIDILKEQPIKNKISFYYTKEERENIASKGGSSDEAENDTCYLELPKGNFTFTILSRNTPSDVYSIVTMAKSGKMIVDTIRNNWRK